MTTCSSKLTAIALCLSLSACASLSETSGRTAGNANEALKPAVGAVSATGESSGRVAENARGALRPAIEKLQAAPAATSRVIENAADLVKSPTGTAAENSDESEEKAK